MLGLLEDQQTSLCPIQALLGHCRLDRSGSQGQEQLEYLLRFFSLPSLRKVCARAARALKISGRVAWILPPLPGRSVNRPPQAKTIREISFGPVQPPQKNPGKRPQTVCVRSVSRKSRAALRGSQSAVPATNQICNSRFTKCCAGHEICTSRLTTKCCSCNEIFTSRFTKCCACHEICTSRSTKCCACHEICTSRFTNCCTSHEICTSRFTKCCTCNEICTSRFTKCCACYEICTSRYEICTSRFTKCCTCHEICTSRFTKCCICHEICTSRVTECGASKSANEPHVQQSRFTAPVTKSELLDDHQHVRSAAPATKTPFRSNTAPIPCTCHEKSTLKHQKMVSPAPATKSDHHVPKCARHHNESAVARSTRRRHPDSASLCSGSAH